MQKPRSFFGSAIFYTLGVILAQGLTFLLTQILFPRVLVVNADITNVGLYTNYATILGTIIGLEAASSLNNARLKFGVDKLDRYTSSLLGIGMLMAGLVAVVIVAFQGFFTSTLTFPLPVLLLSVVQGFFSFAVVLLAQKCRVLNQPQKFVLWTALVCVLRLLFSMLFVTNMREEQYLGDVYGSVLAYAAVGIAAIIVMAKNGRSVGNAAYWKYCLLLTVPLVFHTLASQILSYSDQFMLTKMFGKDYASSYTYVYGIALLANAIWLAFNNAWSVWYFDRTEEGAAEAIQDLYKKYAGFVTLFTFALVLVAPDLVQIFGDGRFPEGIYLTPIIMLGCYFMFLYTFPVGYETYKHKTVYIAVGTALAAGINVGLNFIFIPLWGSLGAAFTTLIAYIFLFLFHYIIASRIIKGFQISFVQLLIPALIMAGLVGFTYLTLSILWLRWVLAVVSLVGSYMVFRRSRHIMM